MVLAMKALAIIPARGGSKRLPKKNFQPLGGKPLAAYALAAAQESSCFQQILLSSDDEDILSLADGFNGVTPHKRPARLAGDHVTALTLVCEIVDNFQESYDAVALLLPTCPFRTAQHIREGFDLLSDDSDGVVSLTAYEFPPQLSVVLEHGLVSPVFDPCPLLTGDTRSQDQKTMFRPNGGFYIQWTRSFEKHRNFWRGRVRGYVMDRLDSLDIDTRTDLEYAEFMMQRRGGNREHRENGS